MQFNSVLLGCAYSYVCRSNDMISQPWSVASTRRSSTIEQWTRLDIELKDHLMESSICSGVEELSEIATTDHHEVAAPVCITPSSKIMPSIYDAILEMALQSEINHLVSNIMEEDHALTDSGK